ncbi:type II secretion system secretin GspD [Kordiimonas sp.]|uniref:type II secretion system secretin GspD n=1 Tax=Kordiimonas sp. TaxID=1970157 RepID=UPI003A8F0AC5
MSKGQLSFNDALGCILKTLPVVVLLTGCSNPGDDVKFGDSVSIRSEDFDTGRPSVAEISGTGIDSKSPKGPRAEYIFGSGEMTQKVAAMPTVRENADGALSLTFKNTDIRIVIRAVLADTLKLAYVIDPRVQGNVTLETSGPISKESLRVTLEALLKTKGYALVPSSDGYLVLPVADAPRNVSTIKHSLPASTDLPGFAVQVVPLSYTVPSEMTTLLEPFAPSGGILRTDDSRGFLILAGTSDELSSMMRAIETFDVDRMAGMSFAIFSLNYVEADQIIKELKELYAGEADKSSSAVQFIAVPRINRVIAIARNKVLLKSVETWIEKLDLGESSPGRRIYVYQVKNGRAADIADTLNLILGTKYGGGGYGNQYGRGTGENRETFRNGPRGLTNNNRNANAFDRDGNFDAGEGGLGDRGVRIVSSEENNSVVIMATPSEFGVIETALKQIDLPPRQVLVEVTLAEVGLTDELRYGLQWHFEFGDNTVALGQSATPKAQFPGFSWQHTASSSASAVLNALESMTDVKVISSPKILVLNNQSATLQVGDEVPVPTATAVSTADNDAPIVNSIQYRNTGVILTVTPRINDGGLVMLDVEQELSNVVETSSSGIDAPTIQQRKMSSSIAVQNGSTIALGGLIRSTASNVRSGVPFLKDIPLLGAAFRNTDLVERRTELVVLLTPRIIRDVEETRDVMNYLRKEFQSLLGEGDEPKSED